MEANNDMAMREALEEALAYCESDQKSGIAYSDNDVLVPMLRAALAAPARNCDRFARAAEATRAFQVSRGHAVLADACLWDDRDEIGAFIEWLFEPEKGGAQ